MAAKPLPTPEYPQLSPAAPLSLPLPPTNLSVSSSSASLTRYRKIYIYIFFLWKRTIQCQENVREKSRHGTCVKFKSKGVNIDFIFHRSYFLEEELIQQILKLDLSINFIKVYIYHIGNKILQIFTYIVKKNVTICL